VLMILDGFGYREDQRDNAIAAAHTRGDAHPRHSPICGFTAGGVAKSLFRFGG
jgi:bisphosphoglycerate-independent phosphoglycerate mutase (AlkP superfamily)